MAETPLTSLQLQMAAEVAKCFAGGYVAVQLDPEKGEPPFTNMQCHTVARYLSEIDTSRTVVFHESDGLFYSLPFSASPAFRFKTWKP